MLCGSSKLAKTGHRWSARVHTQTATMWNNVNETDKEEFTVIYETVEEEILSKTEVSEVVKPVKKVHRKRKAKTRQG